MEVQISCENLKLGYGAGVLVDDLSFTVEKGDYVSCGQGTESERV